MGDHRLMARLRLLGSMEDYRRKIESGEMQAHVFNGGFVLTELKDYTHPTERVLNVLLLGGRNLDSWKHEAHEKVKTFARENGAVAIELICRLGLAKKMTAFGYRKRRVTMRLELDELQTVSQEPRLSAAA